MDDVLRGLLAVCACLDAESKLIMRSKRATVA